MPLHTANRLRAQSYWKSRKPSRQSYCKRRKPRQKLKQRGPVPG